MMKGFFSKIFGGGGSSQRSNAIPSDLNAPKELKLVLVGDDNVGKSFLLAIFELKISFEDFDYGIHSIEKSYGTKNFQGKQVNLLIIDSLGDSPPNVSRQITYNRADCFMLCVSVNNKKSL